jgi:hypothetical protein
MVLAYKDQYKYLGSTANSGLYSRSYFVGFLVDLDM